MDDEPEVADFDPAKFRASMVSMRVFVRQMFGAWMVIFPVAILNPQIVAGIRDGNWKPMLWTAPIAVLVVWVAWKFRKAMAMLLDDQNLDDHHADLVRAYKRREVARLEAEEEAAAAAEKAIEDARIAATVEDLVELRESFSDPEGPEADT